ncbi:MAG: YfhO family protein [Ekhidna sp.]
MKKITKDLFPHLLSFLIFFILVAVIFHHGLFSEKVLNQHDILQWKGGAQEAIDYRDTNEEEALWVNSMFSGMPAYLVSTKYWGDLTQHVQTLISLGIPRPYSLIFLAMACFYILLKTFNVNSLVASLGSIGYGVSTFMTIGIIAGHNSRIAAIAFLPLVIAGIRLVFDGKYKWGFVLTALALALEIRVNHLQITYYLLLIIGIYGISELIQSFKKKDIKSLKLKVPILLLAATLGIGANFGMLRTITSYSKYSMRGPSELDNRLSGLEKSYAFEFSNSIAEPLVLFIPNFFGGASNQELSDGSNLAKQLKKRGLSRNQVKQNIQSVPTYWGKQRLSAPYYIGATLIFLSVLAIFTVEKKHRNWILVVTGLGIVLSWGENFQLVNYFLFDYLPGYNKFRSVTFVIILSIFGIALLGSLALQKVLIEDKLPTFKQFVIAIAITGGFALVAAILAGMGSYKGAADDQLLAQQIPDWYLDAIRDDRQRLLRIDAMRSAFIVFISATIVWLHHKKKMAFKTAIFILIGVVSIDLISVNKRYVKKEAFQENAINNYFKPTPADEVILQNNTSGSRVLNLQGTFNESKTSYLHSSIGGYHGAKLGRYQDLIVRGISPEMNELINDLQSGSPQFSSYHILNMLNTGFLKYGPNPENVIQNPSANGNAWFVSTIEKVSSPIEEISKVIEIDTKTTAVVDVSKFDIQLSKIITGQGAINLVEKSPKKLTYQSTNSTDAFAVFSEIHYPDGWKAFINDEEVPIIRANYVLRGLTVPAGQNEIVFTFDPKEVATGNLIMLIFSSIIILCFGSMIVFSLIRKDESKG